MRRTARLLTLGATLAASIGIALYVGYTGPLLWATGAIWLAVAWTMWRVARQTEAE